MVIAGVPVGDIDVPDGVTRIAGGRHLQARWRNQLGGLAFEIAAGDREPRSFVKWAPRGSGLDLEAERVRLGWAGASIRVPEVLHSGGDEQGDWLVTRAIDGESAVAERWLAEPATAVRAIGEGLRALHDTLPVADCPFEWSAPSRVAVARAGGIVVSDSLLDTPEIDRLVVCHGDACAPNTLLDARGRWLAHVDLGELGLADRWADITIAAWSTEWNYGPGWEGLLLDSYGITLDADRSDHYRRLWDST